MYNAEKQYRCTIIRGKAQTELDNLLPAYCRIIQAITPISKEDFAKKFNDLLSKTIGYPVKKTLDNHRTEIAGKLLGLWYESGDFVQSSHRCIKLLENSDNPAFFKEIVIKFQFPNVMDKLQTIRDRVDNKINFRPTPFVLALLKLFEIKKKPIFKNEIAFYVLNNLCVLQGKSTVQEVAKAIISDRTKNIFRKVEVPRKSSSFGMQHITEYLNLLELANLIRVVPNGIEKQIMLKNAEMKAIDHIIEKYLNKTEFDIYKYDLSNKNDVEKMKTDWDSYYVGELSCGINLSTNPTALIDPVSTDTEDNKFIPSGRDTLTIGDDGEKIVMAYEKDRVSKYNKRLVNKVIHFGKQKGLGYDVSSIFAIGHTPEHTIYIEVKTALRVTEPQNDFSDQFDMTRNEWVAAEQHKDCYFIYRVYLFNKGYKLFKMCSPAKLREENAIYAEPLKYHIEFTANVCEELK